MTEGSRFKVLIVDQFSSITPYSLQEHHVPFDALAEQVIAEYKPSSFRKPEIREVTDDFVPELCTTVIRANAEGVAECWKYHWDST